METRLGDAITVDREVQFGEISYPFHIRAGRSSWTELRRTLTMLDADRFVVVADSGLPEHLVAEAKAHLSSIAPTVVLTADATERAKTLATVDWLAEQTIRTGATRQSIVVGLGGGWSATSPGYWPACYSVASAWCTCPPPCWRCRTPRCR